ncbi:MAG: single-stranded DNA-binding protein [Acutalibacteraceae bacterium]|nr:single-stranded DNA-binding protein [Acutalibacteraceae bacterium]
MLNIAVIMGRLTADPELRTTQNGISVCSFSVAVERNYETNGKRETDFINCVAWRQTAEFISRYFHKGSMIAINGSIQQRQYTDKDGNKRSAFEILVDNANFCGSKAENGNAADVQVDDSNFDEVDIDDGDLPF